MTLVNEEIVRDMELAREVLSTTDCSVVVISYGKIWKKKTGEGISPILETIEEMGEDIQGSIIGDRIFLGIPVAFVILAGSTLANCFIRRNPEDARLFFTLISRFLRQ